VNPLAVMTKSSIPGPQMRGTGGTLSLIMFGMGPGPPARKQALTA
jgi:hypothetical protein